MGLVGLAVKLALGLVLALAAAGGIAYAADYGIEASITDTHCVGSSNPAFPDVLATAAGDGSTVDVRTHLFGIQHTVAIDRHVCAALRPDNFVVYHVRSGHTILYTDDSRADCIYDSAAGPGC